MKHLISVREDSMQKIYIISNSIKDEKLNITNKIISILNKKNINTKVTMVGSANKDSNDRIKNVHEIDNDTDCILVIGGDGTFIQAARDLAEYEIPIVGINLGYLGYLAEIEPENIDTALEKLVSDEYSCESRIMLNGDVIRNGKIVYNDISLNDIVLGRFGNLRVIDFKIYVNDEFLNLYSADGVIIATPTGSTAYNLSAGGPVLEPRANIISVTPICSHTLGARSIVLSADSTVDIEICKNRHSDDNDKKVYFDGNSSFVLDEGDIIRIKKSNLVTKILKLNKMSFVEVLHRKMNLR